MRITDLFEQTIGSTPVGTAPTLTGPGTATLADPKLQAANLAQARTAQQNQRRTIQQQIQMLQQQLRNLQQQQSDLNKTP